MRSGENRRGFTEGFIIFGVFGALVAGTVVAIDHEESQHPKGPEKSVVHSAATTLPSACKTKHLSNVVLRAVAFNDSSFAHGSLFSDPVDKVPNMKEERDNKAHVTKMKLLFAPGTSLADANAVYALTDIRNHFYTLPVEVQEDASFISQHEVVTGHYFKDDKNPNAELVELGTIDQCA